LPGDATATSTWILPPGLSGADESKTGTMSQIWLSGQRPFPGRATCTNCGEDTATPIDPNSDPVFMARKGYYRASTLEGFAAQTCPLDQQNQGFLQKTAWTICPKIGVGRPWADLKQWWLIVQRLP
jgi:hypothetical protein